MFARQQQQQQQQPSVADQNKSFEDYQQQPQLNNYDMTILHMDFEEEEDDDDSFFYATKTSTNQKKPIPQWARSMFLLRKSICIDRCCF